MNANNFKTGDRFVGMKKTVRVEGVCGKMPAFGNGIISPRCCGNAKPAYAPIPAGSTLLVDAANLLGAIGPVDAARNLEIVGRELERRGFKVAFFLEHRAWGWCMYRQDTERQSAAWREFSRDSRLSMVDGESDLAMLQVARVMPGAYVCTRDHLADYAKTYHDIVGERRRSFSVTNLNGRIFLAIDGLVDAIVLDPDAYVHEREVVPASSERKSESAVSAFAVQREMETPELSSKTTDKHERIANPVRYLNKVASKNGSAYHALADHFAGKDAKLERKYLRLAAVAEKRGRETRRRDTRRFKAARRSDGYMGHFSRQKRRAVGLAEVAFVHDNIVGYLAENCVCARVRGRAA